jgi:glycogen synthase
VKILMTSDAVGGVWGYSMELARALHPHGVEIVLACMGPAPSQTQLHEAAALPNVSFVHAPFELEWMDDPWSDVEAAGEWLLDVARAFSPDLVQINGYCHAPLDFGVPVIVVAHSCVSSWWNAVQGGAPPPEWDRYRAEVTRGLRAADRIIAPSHAMLCDLHRDYVFDTPAAVVPNGRDPRLFHAGEKEEFVFTAGRLWDRAKNLETAVEAAARFDWPLVCAGEGIVPVAPNVRFLGFLSREALAGWFARASIYLLPARYEPFGLSVVEAALSGCALVLGDIPSLRENWEEAAVFVPSEDPIEIAEAVGELSAHAELRSRLAAAARSRARELSPESMAGLYMHWYSATLAAGERRGAAQREARS